jgi:hypothetical protein
LTMSKTQMAMLSLLAVAMFTVLIALDLHRYPATRFVAMPADGSAPPLPAPIEVGPGRIP